MQKEETLPEGILEGNIDGFKKKEYLYKFAVDKWYEKKIPKECTFETRFVELSVKEGEAIIGGYRNNYRKVTLEKEHERLLEELRSKLDKVIKELGGSVFVKLNYRSPKDVAIEKGNDKTRLSLWNNMTQLHRSKQTPRRGDQIRLWLSSLVQSLQCRNGSEAVYLLTHSFRIKQDLSEDLQYPDFFKSKIVVRRFNPSLDPRFEFRGFVSNGELTALSQYEAGIFFRDVFQKRQKYQDLIVDFFNNTIQEPLKDLSNYVIDFAIINDEQVLVVELNPFHAQTSGCMFSWKNDRDIILNGPFTFRVESNPQNDGFEALPDFWPTLIDDYKNAKVRVHAIFISCYVIFFSAVFGFLLTYECEPNSRTTY